MAKHQSKDFIQVPRRQLTKMIGKLTYPEHCLHACGDSAVCDGCHYFWEKRAMEVRTSLLALCKYKPNTIGPDKPAEEQK